MVSDAVLRASQDLNKAATRSDASKAPVGLYLACGSQRIGMSKGVGCRSEGQSGLELKTYKVLIAESLLP